MAVIVNGDGILTGISSLATSLTDITSGRGTVTGVATVGTLQLGAGVSISSPRSQQAAIFTNNTEFFTVDDAGRVGVGTITPNSDAHPENEKKINVGFITAKSIAGDIDARNVVVAGISTFVGALNATSVVSSGAVSGTTGAFTGDVSIADKIIHTGDTNTALRFPAADTITAETGGSERLRITSSGHLSLGGSDLTKTWSLGKAMHIGVSENALWGEGDYAFHMMQNAYYNGGWKYTHTDEASLYSSADGKHIFYTAASGSADSAITWGERFRIAADGNITIGGDGDSGSNPSSGYDELCIEGGNESIGMCFLSPAANNVEQTIAFGDSNNNQSGMIQYEHANDAMHFNTAGAERIRIDDYGVLRVGNTHDQTTSGNTKRIALGAKASIWGWASGQINGALTLADNYYWDGANNKAIESDYSAYLTLRSGSLRFGATASTQTGGSNISGGINEKVRFQQGGGISFNGDTASANALNDYEEGTFTGGINDFNGTYVSRTGTYTKIGNVVTIQIMISGNGGSGSGSLILTSLPFSSEGTPSSYRAVGAIHAHTGVVTGGVQVIGLMNNNENKIRLRTVQNNATTTDLNRNGLNTSGWELVIGMVYHTAA